MTSGAAEVSLNRLLTSSEAVSSPPGGAASGLSLPKKDANGKQDTSSFMKSSPMAGAVAAVVGDNGQLVNEPK